MPSETSSQIELDVRWKAELLEQEHRPLRIAHNLWKSRRLQKGDLRRAASQKAARWWLLLRLVPAIAVVGAAGGGWIGLWFAYESNQLLDKQTAIMSRVAESDLRTRLIEMLYKHADRPSSSQQDREIPLPSADLGVAAYSHRARAESLKSFVDLERHRLRDAANQRVDVSYALLDHIDATGFDLHGVDLSHANLVAAHLMQADLTGAKLRGADLSGAGLMNAVFASADLENAILSYSHWANTDFSGAKLSGAFLVGVDPVDCKLETADLTGAVLALADAERENREPPPLVAVVENLGWRVVNRPTERGGVITVVEAHR